MISGNKLFYHPNYIGYFKTVLYNANDLMTIKYCAIQKMLLKYMYNFK